MQFTKIAIALAIVSGFGTAAAAPDVNRIAISSGASASKGNLAIGMASLCTAAAGVFTEFTNGTSNVSAYVCANAALTSGPAGTYATLAPANFILFAGTQFAELRLNVGGGSFTSVCQVGNWPSGTQCPPQDNYVNPAAAVLATLEVEPAGSRRVGGLTDLEPNGFLPTVRAGIANVPGAQLLNAGFIQTFGVAVSNELYNAMYTAQAATLGVGCTGASYSRPECVPVIGKAQMASIMSGNTASDAYVRGANFLAPQLGNPTQLTYARRVNTSGTQAAAQQYFLGSVCNTSPLTVVVGGGSANAITVANFGSTGNVRTQLNGAGFSIGIMSGENNQAETWKWIRVGGMQMAESALPADGSVTVTNTATAKNGTYDFWFLSRVARTAAVPAAEFWTPVVGAINAAPFTTTKGLFRATETNFTKGLNACTPVSTS